MRSRARGYLFELYRATCSDWSQLSFCSPFSPAEFLTAAFTSLCMLLVARKDVLSTTHKSSVIHKYKCHCDSRYVERTSQRLQDRIKQHISQWLRQQLTRPRRSQPHRSCKRNDTKPECGSAIGQHLLGNDQCALNYDNKRFSILATARSSFHLNLLETAYIKSQRPVLCRQKEFVYALKLFR